MNLLDTPIISTQSARHSLPGLLAALSRHEVETYPALRPHQRPAWHMFLVQLGALALQGRGLGTPPEDEGAWRDLLLGLTNGDATAWVLVGPADRPAFLQPADPGGLKWSRVETPDALDMLILSKNHDLKQAVARHAAPEDWVFALVSLQTMSSYGGKLNYNVTRMSSAWSSRPMLAFAPSLPCGGVDASGWWQRDVLRLLAVRLRAEELSYGTPGGPALLWTLPWPEGQQLALTTLDPWFIEICRRIRLIEKDGRLSVLRSTSIKMRVNADGFNGVTGDPWTPVTMEANPEPLNLAFRSFNYKLITELLFSNPKKWALPALAIPDKGEASGLIVAEAFSRVKEGTLGFKSRIVPVPGWARPLFVRPDLGALAKDQITEISIFDMALRNGLALVAAGGSGDKLKGDSKKKNPQYYPRASAARDRFDRAADALFFEALWTRAAAQGEDRDAAMRAFVTDLFRAACTTFDLALPAIPCATILRPRAEARGRQAFEATIRRGHGHGGETRFDFLFPVTERLNDDAA